MHSKKLHKSLVFIAFCMFSFSSLNISAQINGSWRLEKTETVNKEFRSGKLNKWIAGVPGELKYTDDNGNTGSKFIVSCNWNTPPTVAIPGNDIVFSSLLKIEKFIPPKHHYKPVVNLYIQTYRLTEEFKNRKWSKTWYHTNVSGDTKDPTKNVSINQVTKVAVPFPKGERESIFIIGVKMGSSSANKEVLYIYKWTDGINNETEGEIVEYENYWKLIDITPEKKEKVTGDIKRLVKGNPGSLKYINEFGTNGMYGIKVQSRWDKLPDILYPNKKVTIGYQCETSEYNPPTHHWKPSVTFYFHDYYPVENPSKIKLNNKIGIMQILVNSREKNNLFKGKDFAVILPPEPCENNPCYYIIRVRFGSTDGSMTYYYKYKWMGNKSNQ